MIGNACTGSLSEIEAEVEAVGMVDRAECAFGLLGKGDDFECGGRGEGCEGVRVLMGNDENVSGGVGEAVEANKAVGPAVDDERCLFGLVSGKAASNGVVDCRNHIAEDAVPIGEG